MTAASIVLSPARDLRRLGLMHVAMVLSVGLAAAPAAGSSLTTSALTPTSVAPTATAITQAYGKLPVRFEANQGQTDGSVRFLARTGGATVFLTPQGAVWSLPAAGGSTSPAAVRMSLAGANVTPVVMGTDVLPGVSNYFIGNDPAKWRTNVPSYSGVRYSNVYPGIDQIYHAGAGGMEYDFVIAPGADPSAIAISVSGASSPAIDAKGDLVVSTAAGQMRQHAPSLYQQVGGERRTVAGRFAVRRDGSFGFKVGGYDRARPLVIDPILSYSTLVGAAGEDGVGGVALDSSNNAYVTGWTTSSSFPVTTGAYQGSCGTKCNNGGTTASNVDAFVTKLNPAGTALVYSSYLGGANGSSAAAHTPVGVAADASGNAYISGTIYGGDFPTPNGYKTTCGTTGTPCVVGNAPTDAWLAKLSSTGGSLLYGTYIGGSGDDRASGLALGSGGIAYVSGTTSSSDFVAADPGSATAYKSTYGGGQDGFLIKVDTGMSGSGSLLYSTFLGGSGSDSAKGVAVDPATPNIAYVAGSTQSTDFPTTTSALQTGLGGGAQSGTISKLDTTLGTAGLLYSSYVGGTNGGSLFNGLSVKASVAYVVGQSSSTTYPVNGTNAAYQTTNNSGNGNANLVISEIDTSRTGTAALLYSTYLGGTTAGGGEVGYAIAADAGGKLTVTGQSPPGFPLVHQIQGFSTSGAAVVAQLDPAAGTSGLVYSTAIGGGLQPNDAGYAVAVDAASPSDAFVGGVTGNSSFGTTGGAFQTGYGGGTSDGFVIKLAPGNAPAVTGLSPTSGVFTGGTSVVITGSSFTGATAVNFGSVPATSFAVNSDTQVTAVSPCVAPSNGACPDSALGTVTADTVNVTVTASGAASSTSPADLFLFGEGSSASAASCPTCTITVGGDAAVALADGRILNTETGVDHYADGVTVKGLNVFTSGTAVSHQRTFTAADVGKRLSASQSVSAASEFLFASGTTITGVSNSNTVTLSTNARQSATGASFSVSNNATALYSPATNTWVATGPCNACGLADYNDGSLTLTLLPSGKVLAAGGMDPTGDDQSDTGTQAVPEAYLYDPAAGAWSATGPLTSARKGATATLLSTGKVLVAGGSNTGIPSAQNVDAYRTAELYDPSAGTFAATGSMTTARDIATTAVLAGGNVLVAGGFITGHAPTNGAPATATAELYNPGTGTWSSAGSMNTPRAWNTMTALPSSGACGSNCGKVLVANGNSCYNNCPVTSPTQDARISAELYNPTTNTWAYTGAPSVGRSKAEAALMASGRVLVANGGGGVNNAAERYDPAAETWRSAGLSVGEDGCCALVMPAGPTSVCGTNCGKVFLTRPGAGFYTPRPVVSGVAPASGAGFGGTTVTITGTGLASVTQVRFGSDMSATATAVPDPATPDTKLTAVTPGELGNGATGGSVDTTVVSPGGVSSISSADQYTYGTFGSLQVSTSPSLASQITVDNVYRDTTAVANLKIASGSHTVCFREVPGYLPVSCQNVTVSDGQTTTATGTFVQKGTLNVTTNASGGSVRVGPASSPQGSNVTARDDSSINTDLAVGSYDVCFGPVLNQNPPPCQTVSVTAGQTTTVTGTYTSHLGSPGDDPTLGFIKVVTSPAGLGTQISVDNIPRNTGSIKNLKIAAGSHTVCFREVTGYLPSACQNISVTAALTTSVTGTFVAKGTLTVTETPSGTAGTVFVDGTPRDDGGMSTDLPVGTSQVCFGAVSGHVTPACRSVTITGGQTVSTTGAY